MTERGSYRHYKGGVYEVLGIAEHTETSEQYIVYTDKLEGRLWVRPQSNFDGEVEVDGISQPRFCYLGASGDRNVSG